MDEGVEARRRADLRCLQARLGVEFPTDELLRQALIHRSFAQERKLGSDNERLEFLGDAVLELAVSEHLYSTFRHAPEGALARLRASVVAEPSLAAKARDLRLGEHILLGRGEEHAGGRKLDSLLANALEAIIGAIYLKLGYGVASAFVLDLVRPELARLWESKDYIDPKSALQEQVQQVGVETPTYCVDDEQGPPHDKMFYVSVCWQGQLWGKGRGRTKKEAEQAAARDALQALPFFPGHRSSGGK